MNLKLIVVILLIATMPMCAEAQTSNNATVTRAQNAFKIISGDKAKTRIYCDMAKVFDQIEQAGGKDTAKTDKLYRKMSELAKKLGQNTLRWCTDFRESIRIPRTLRKSIRPSRRSTSCVRNSARSLGPRRGDRVLLVSTIDQSEPCAARAISPGPGRAARSPRPTCLAAYCWGQI